MYMLQRQSLYAVETESICRKDKIYMLQRQRVYVAKTKFICCTHKSTVLGVSAPAGAFFSPEDASYFFEDKS